MYDIIGDVHGYAKLLKKLLTKLGYKKMDNGGYSHSERRAIFVGDFINRGPEIRKTLKIIRTMVEDGNAYAILGNHELNAIIYHIKDSNGNLLVKSPGNYFISLFKTINAFSNNLEEWVSHLQWMRTLPLFFERDGIRVVHACWSPEAIGQIKEVYEEGKLRKSTIRKIYKKTNDPISKSIWLATKGINFKIPSDIRILNNKGVSPRSFRIRWWEEPAGLSFNQLSFESKFTLPNYTIPEQILPSTIPYAENEVPLFFGHYCRPAGPYIVKPNICCVDSCVAGTKILSAYRWNGENQLTNSNFYQVSN